MSKRNKRGTTMNATISTRTAKGLVVELEPSIEHGYPEVYARVDLGWGNGPERLLVRDWHAEGSDEGARVYPISSEGPHISGPETLLLIPKADHERAVAVARQQIAVASEPVPSPLPAGWRWSFGSCGVGQITYLPGIDNPNTLETLRSLAEDQGKAAELRPYFARGVAYSERTGVLLRPLTDSEWATQVAGMLET